VPSLRQGGTDYEAECATCFHGVSMHRFVGEGAGLREECVTPGCDCDEFLDPEEADA
jgi:hypothetical protein